MSAHLAHVRWDKGGEASVLSVDREGIVLRSTTPAPPGARIAGVLTGEPAARLRVKVHASKKQAEGDFVVAGRLIDATREVTERLVRLSEALA
jgi:hypothetical protein